MISAFLTERHVGQLSFLVVCDHPNFRQRRERRDLRADADVLSGFDLALTDHAVLRGYDFCITQVEFGDRKRRSLSLDGSSRLGFLSAEYALLASGRLRLSTSLRELSGQLRTNGFDFLGSFGR